MAERSDVTGGLCHVEYCLLILGEAPVWGADVARDTRRWPKNSYRVPLGAFTMYPPHSDVVIRLMTKTVDEATSNG